MKFEDYPNVDNSNVFNKELKEKFLSTLTGEDVDELIIQYIRLFNRTGISERGAGKDLCMFNYTDYMSMFEVLGITTYHSVTLTKTLVSNYVMFCIGIGIIPPEDLAAIKSVSHRDISGSISLSIRMFKDYDEIIDFLDTIDEYFNYDTMLMKKGVFLLTYLGFDSDEIPLIRKSDFNEDKSVIMYNNKIIPLDRYSRMVFSDIISSHSVELTHGQWSRYNDTSYLIRVIGHKPFQHVVPKHYITRTFSEYKKLASQLPIENKFYGKQCSHLSVLHCGYYHRLFNYMQEHDDILLEIAYRDKINEITRGNFDKQTKFYAFVGNYKQWLDFYHHK